MSTASTRPTLTTERLILRPFTVDDASWVERYAGDREVASTTLRIPHPYPPGAAELWIATHEESFARGQTVDFAITLAGTGEAIGSIGLRIDAEHSHAEVGYWMAVPFWGQGYGSEAARALVRYGFEVLGLHRIFACHMARNPGSGRVLQNAGMRHEGCLRQHVQKWGQFEDSEYYGILRSEYEAAAPESR